jgi:hypothetical protein
VTGEEAIITWEDPPNANLGSGTSAVRWRPVAEALRLSPKRWAVVMEGASGKCSNVATYIKIGSGPFWPAGHFEAVTRRVGDGPLRRTYARYVGEPA